MVAIAISLLLIISAVAVIIGTLLLSHLSSTRQVSPQWLPWIAALAMQSLVRRIRSSCCSCRKLVQELQIQSRTGIVELLVLLVSEVRIEGAAMSGALRKRSTRIQAAGFALRGSGRQIRRPALARRPPLARHCVVSFCQKHAPARHPPSDPAAERGPTPRTAIDAPRRPL